MQNASSPTVCLSNLFRSLSYPFAFPSPSSRVCLRSSPNLCLAAVVVTSIECIYFKKFRDADNATVTATACGRDDNESADADADTHAGCTPQLARRHHNIHDACCCKRILPRWPRGLCTYFRRADSLFRTFLTAPHTDNLPDRFDRFPMYNKKNTSYGYNSKSIGYATSRPRSC